MIKPKGSAEQQVRGRGRSKGSHSAGVEVDDLGVAKPSQNSRRTTNAPKRTGWRVRQRGEEVSADDPLDERVS